MKQFIIILSVCLSVYTAQAQKGVPFMEGKFQEALSIAHEQKRILFVDVYTSWCMPCKWMNKQVFSTQEAADFFKDFVCLKIDAEKGEGIDFAKKYDIHAYPTFLMFLPDGTLQHKFIGGDSLKQFIPKVERGLNKKTSWTYLMRKYKNGNLSQKDILHAMQVFKDANMNVALDTLFDMLSFKNKVSNCNVYIYDMLGYFDLYSQRFDFLICNYEQIGKGRFVNVALNKINSIIIEHLSNYTTGFISKERNSMGDSRKSEISYIKSLLEKSDIPDKKFLLAWCNVAQSVYEENKQGLKKAIENIAIFPESKSYRNTFWLGYWRLLPKDQQAEMKALEKLWD